MANYFTDNDDIQYYIEKGIDWEPLVRLTEYDFKAEEGFKSWEEAVDVYRDILNLVGEFSAEEIAPRSKAIDQAGITFKDGEAIPPEPLDEIFNKIKELGLHAMCVPRELGGMNTPLVAYLLGSELIARGDVSVMAHQGFHGGIAMVLLIYSILEGSTEFQQDPPMITSTRFADEITEIISGEAWGSMDITEPDAGSDMARIRCKGEQDEDGNWYVTGQKILITSGHGKYHVVIARTEAADEGDAFAGLKGLSLFLVPAYSDENGERKRFATLDNLESKLGHHGSATVSVGYDRTPAQLIGKPGEGFKLMLLLMNNARVSVGFEAIGLCEAAYRMARDYAAERPSMGKMIAKHEMIADYLDEMHTDIQAIRAIAVSAAYSEEMGQKIGIALQAMPLSGDERQELEKKQRKLQRRARFLTPLVKYYGAEKSVEMARKAVQILGGPGYTKDYGAEKLLRDAMVFPIYEGTSQIQALMAMKDNLMDVLKRPQAFARNMARARAASLAGRHPLERRVASLQTYCFGALRHLISQLAVGKFKEVKNLPLSEWSRAFTKDWNPKRDFAMAMLHAERLTQMLADKAIAEVLLEQALKHHEREDVLVRFLERAEPRCRYNHQVITTTGSRLLALLRKEEMEEESTSGR